MKRLAIFPAILALLLLAAPAWATTYYVDAKCPTAGNGTSASCLSSPTTNNPKVDIPAGISLLAAGGGDTLNIRGVHSAHDNCPGDTEGRYYSDQITISGKTAGTTIIQPNGYAGIGTGESVYIDGTKFPSGGWTKCADCSGTGPVGCQNVPGTCGDAWYATDSGTANKAIGAQKIDGTMTYRVLALTALNGPNDTPTSGYAGTSPEVDSYSGQGLNAVITVKWGQGANSPCAGSSPCTTDTTAGKRFYVFNNNNGFGFYVTNTVGLTIQGLTFRCHKGASILFIDDSGATQSNTVADVHILYDSAISGTGPDYGIAFYRTVSATVKDSEFGWTGSEAIHSQANHTATALTVQHNWMHDLGDQNVMGPQAIGTPSGSIFGDDAGFGDYTGSIFENNLLQNLRGNLAGGTSVGRGLILENSSSNWIVRNNVWSGVAATCLKLDSVGAGTAHVDNNQIYNNLFDNCGTLPGGTTSPGILAVTSSGKTLQNNVIYNNAFTNSLDGSINLQTGGTISGNLIRNNVFYDVGSKKVVDWQSGSGTDIYENNLAFSATLPGGNNLVGWTGAHISGGPNYTCAQMANVAASDKCSDPIFTSSSDFHIQTTSPAKDAGTSTGMPSGRTADINNSLASLHGLPSYADGQPQFGPAWDMGPDEFSQAGAGGRRTMIIAKRFRPRIKDCP